MFQLTIRLLLAVASITFFTNAQALCEHNDPITLSDEDQEEFFHDLACELLASRESSVSPTALAIHLKQMLEGPERQELRCELYTDYLMEKKVPHLCERANASMGCGCAREAIDNEEQDNSVLDSILEESEKSVVSAAYYEIIELCPENLDEVLSCSRPVIIDVYTDWCWPCKRFAPVFKEVNGMLGDRYQFVKLDAGLETEIANRFKIQAFPTILFLENGEEVGRVLGAMSKKKFLQEIRAFLGN